MAKPDDALNLALAQIVRRDWPAVPPMFAGQEPCGDATPDSDALTDAIIRGRVHADRATCQLSPARVAAFRDAPGPRTLIVNLVDAEPAVPLQLYWALANAGCLSRCVLSLARSLGADLVLVAVPHDVPVAWRSKLATAGTLRGVPTLYPSGFRRLLPRALGMSAARPSLVLDAVAIVDAFESALTGFRAYVRPIALSGDDGAHEFRCVPRGTRIVALADEDLERQWYAGPRLADVACTRDAVVGDGEMSFYREPRGSRIASACIRCGACVDLCPTRCDPIALATVAGELCCDATPVTPHQRRRATRGGIASCIDCGLCTASCPSAIELHHLIAGLRETLGARGRQ